jgi:hypothetical protein
LEVLGSISMVYIGKISVSLHQLGQNKSMHIEHQLIRDDNYLCAICEIVDSLNIRMDSSQREM